MVTSSSAVTVTVTVLAPSESASVAVAGVEVSGSSAIDTVALPSFVVAVTMIDAVSFRTNARYEVESA